MELQDLCNHYRKNGKKIVFTNGCFDLLHLGHIQYLKEAKSLGDILIIGLNNDTSVKKIKGPNRPIKDENSRKSILECFSFVDHVILFEENTPFELIKKIKPDVLVKGGDYQLDQIVGAKLVEDNGGKVMALSFEEGYSSTALINKIKADEAKGTD